MSDEDLPKNPPQLAVAHAEQGAQAALKSRRHVSLAGIQVAEAMLGIHPFTVNHVEAMAHHSYNPTSTNGLLMGGVEGRQWARASLIAAAAPKTAATAPVPKLDLAAMSRKLNDADRLFREKLESVLSQAMRTATRRAYRKAGARIASARRVNAADRERLNREFRRGRITDAIMAATGTTPDELLDDSFVDASDQVKILFRERQARKRKALVVALATVGLTTAILDDHYDDFDEQREATMTSYVIGAMFNEARSRFDAGAPFSATPLGEIPRDTDIPTLIVNSIIRLADGANLDSEGQVVPADQGTGDATAVLTDYTDDLVTTVMRQFVPGSTTTYTWVVGDPARPFEPHQDLDGQQATNETYFIVFAKDPSDWPYGNTYWLVQDHDGCQCTLETEWHEGQADEFDEDEPDFGDES